MRKSVWRNTVIAVVLAGTLAGATPQASAINLGPTATYLIRVTPAARAAVESAVAKIGGSIESRYNYVFDGFKIKLPTLAYALLSKIPDVLTIEVDKDMSLLSPEYSESPTPSWGLDRIDQRDPVGAAASYVGSYGYKSAGRGAVIYIADTGVSSHSDLAGRLSSSGFSAISDGNGFTDCNGHGTHVATTAAGTQFGVAKNATVVPVRVLNCSGAGTTSSVIAGLDWILSPQNPNPKTAAVVNMSLGGPASVALDSAIERLTNAGVAVVVAAGNSNADACGVSPARASTALTVGATDKSDLKASFSNWGTCVDLNAPGVNITGGWFDAPTSVRTISGTSMASPHVTGAVAVYYGLNPTASVAQMSQFLIAQSTQGALQGLTSTTPNRLLYVSPTDGALPLQLPTAALKAITEITHQSATVAYDINPGGDDTTLQLQYGTDAAFTSGVRTVGLDPVTGYNPLAVSAGLIALTPSTRYFVRLSATSSKGTTLSASSSFVTLAPPVVAPTVSGVSVGDITSYSATLKGTVTAGNASTQVRFQYTTDPKFLTGVSTIAAVPATVSGNVATAVSLPISFLESGKTYYVRLVALNATATTTSDAVSFAAAVAPGLAPTVVTAPRASGPLPYDAAKFTGTVNPQGQTTTVKFTYGLVTGLTSGQTTITLPDLITGTDTIPVSTVIKGLTPGKGYYFRFEALNASGYTKGNIQYGIVDPIAPVVKNTYGNNQTTISAQFNTVGNAGGSNTRWMFDYTTDPTFQTGIQTINAVPFTLTTGVDTSLYVVATGLTPNTKYYFRAKVMAYTGPAAGSGLYIYGPIAMVETLRPTVVAPASPAPTPTPTSSPSPSAAPVAKRSQTITFGAIADREFGPGVALTATASSGLAIAYSVTTPDICRILDLGAGKYSVQTSDKLGDVDTARCSVVASQPGDATFAAATSVTQSFTWRRAAMKIWTGSLTALKVGMLLQVNAFLGLVDTALMSGLKSLNAQITVVSNTPSVCLVDSTYLNSTGDPFTASKIKGVTKGTCSITFSYPATKGRMATSLTVTGAVG